LGWEEGSPLARRARPAGCPSMLVSFGRSMRRVVRRFIGLLRSLIRPPELAAPFMNAAVTVTITTPGPARPGARGAVRRVYSYGDLSPAWAVHTSTATAQELSVSRCLFVINNWNLFLGRLQSTTSYTVWKKVACEENCRSL